MTGQIIRIDGGCMKKKLGQNIEKIKKFSIKMRKDILIWL